VPVSSIPPLPVVRGKAAAPASGASKTGAPATDLVARQPQPPVTFPTPSTKTAFNPKTSVPVGYGANDTIFKNSDGSETKQISPTPLNVQKPDGTWTPIRTSLSQNSKTGGFSVSSNPLNPQFAASLGGSADVSVNSGSAPISMSLVGAASVAATRPAASALHSADEGLGSGQAAVSSSLQYLNAMPGQDLQYQVTNSEVKETLVLDRVPSAAQTSWTWVIHAPGLVMSASDRGSLYLTDADGVVQYNIPDPIMWDSSGVAEQSEPALVDVPFAFAQTADGDWKLTVTPDPSWLADPARVYPVFVDPTLGMGMTSYDAFEIGGTVVANQIRTGNSRAGGNTFWRSVAYFQYNGLEGPDPANWAEEITPGSYVASQYVSGTTGVELGDVLQATAWSFYGIPATPFLVTQWAIGTAAVTNGQSVRGGGCAYVCGSGGPGISTKGVSVGGEAGAGPDVHGLARAGFGVNTDGMTIGVECEFVPLEGVYFEAGVNGSNNAPHFGIGYAVGLGAGCANSNGYSHVVAPFN
jgi:large repetitive protein